MSEPLLSVSGVVKEYQALRPLRLQDLSVGAGQQVSLFGLDAPAAEILVGLITGALLPDAGTIMLFGRSTSDITDSDGWLAMLDGVGIITDRAVLIEQFTVLQNVAMPFTLDLEPVNAGVRPKAEQLARQVGLADHLDTPVGRAGPDAQVRVRIARALALEPRLVIAEHPTATVPREKVPSLARDLGALARGHGVALLSLTADEVYANAIGGTVLAHEPATGALRPRSLLRRWFGG